MHFLSSLVSLLPLLAAATAAPAPDAAGRLARRRLNLAPLIAPPAVPGSPPQLNPHSFSNNGGEPHLVADSYIVRLRDGADLAEVAEHHELVGQFHKADVELRSALRTQGQDFEEQFTGIHHKYEIHDFKGYSGKFSPAVRDAIRALPEVEYVERDSIVWASEIETQNGAPWGLARISHRKPLGFGSFNKYLYQKGAGEGVDAYIVDTGVNINHVEFEGRAKWGKTIPQNDEDRDGNGHGTHVAGTVASAKYGVAKNANIIAVKVLGSGGSGTMADVLAGVAWAATSALAKAKSEAEKSSSKFKGSVANMSLGGGKSPSLNDAVDKAVKSGLHFAVAAGNENADACNTSPASVEAAVTVGATTIADERAYFSNHGKCVDILAPGLNILSTWNTGDKSVNTISGTSMASPHVAGALAYFLSEYPENFEPTDADYLAAGVPVPTSSSSAASTPKRLSSFAPSALSSLFDPTSEAEVIEVVYKIHRGSQVMYGKIVEYVNAGFGRKVAPAPKKTLEPKVLKAALVRIGTSGIITDLPPNTINVLLFNNGTKA